MQRVRRILVGKRAFVWKSKQKQCDNELLIKCLSVSNDTQNGLYCRSNHTDKYQVSLCLYFET